MTALSRLQAWYQSNCDGEWEHAHGIQIQTLDNPGWLVDIELVDTPLAVIPFERIESGDITGEPTTEPWHECWRDEHAWHAGCGPESLETVIMLFLEWAEQHAS